MRNILILFFELFVTGVPARNKTVPGDTISDGRETSLPMITSNIPKSALIHLTEYRKGLYKVSIQDDKSDWRSVEVRNALVSSFSKHPQIWNDWENQKALRDTMSYALFTHHFKRNVKVRIEPGFQFDKVEIRPVSYGIEYKKVDGGIEFELVNASQKVSVEFDGDRAENLFLFPDLPDMDKPDKKESNVLYYGPGQHDVGCIVMKSNQTLYLDEGAFVYGHIVGKRIENIKISGRGVLCGARETHSDEKRTQLMNFVHCRNVEISGVTLIDSPAWTIRLKNSQDLLVDNVKQISWILNSDGLDICNCRHVRVRNCFFRNYDDCITVKNQALAKMGCEDILVENCVGWTDCANVFLVGPECGTTREPRTNYIRNVTFRNCIVLETPALHDSEEGDDGWRGGCAAINARVGTYEGAGGGGRMSDILFENIRIEDLTGGRPIATEIVSDGENTGSLTGVTFRNITFKGSKFLPAQVRGVSKKFPLRNVTLDNVVFNGKYIRKADNKKYLFINPYIENLQFK